MGSKGCIICMQCLSEVHWSSGCRQRCPNLHGQWFQHAKCVTFKVVWKHYVDLLLEDWGEEMSCELHKNDYFIHSETPHASLMSPWANPQLVKPYKKTVYHKSFIVDQLVNVWEVIEKMIIDPYWLVFFNSLWTSHWRTAITKVWKVR
jgi:hypothetical protein